MASLDFKKIGVYAAVAVAVATIYFVRTMDHPVTSPPANVEPAPPVKVKTVPDTCDCKCVCPDDEDECVCTCTCVAPPPPPPPVSLPPKPKPPKVTPKKKPPAKFVPKPRNLSPACRDVPADAYNHPSDVVVAAAVRMGYDPDQIATLKWCIGPR